MKTQLPSEITTKEQAIAFLTDLYKNDESYHPEDDAHDIEDHENFSPLFEDDEADKLNKLMEDIYNLDGNNGNHFDPEFDPCHVLLTLGNLNDLNNRNLLNDIMLNTIKRDVTYTGYLEKNNHTKNWELRISDGDNIVGSKYDYRSWGDAQKDIAKLQEFEIIIEEE